MEKIYTHKTYIGSNLRGESLMELLGHLAEKKYGGNMSRLLIWETLKRNGYDPRTLKRTLKVCEDE